MILVVAVIAMVSICGGRILFRAWYNPVTIYGAIWGVSLTLFEMRFIHYYPLATETWLMIFGAWASLTLGALTFLAARFAMSNDRPVLSAPPPITTVSPGQLRLMTRILWVLNTLGAIVAVQHWMVVLKTFGSVTNVLLMGTMVYSLRTSGAVEGTIPYLGQAVLAGCVLGGIYTSTVGRFSLIGILPLVLEVVISVAAMGRASILIAAVLFLSGYLLNRYRMQQTRRVLLSPRLKRVLTAVLAFLILVLGAELVRSTRGTNENFSASTQALTKLRTGSFITPSIYLYATVHHGVFNQYLLKDREHHLFGSYTFGTVWRVLSKFGFDTDVGQYQQSFYNTPVGANTGTYLMELHSDFGVAGVIFAPYLLGLVATFFWYRARYRGHMLDYSIAAHLLVVVALSFLGWMIQLGYWLSSFLIGLAYSLYYDRVVARSGGEAIGRYAPEL